MDLYHHGIKGQKWGARRFQNRDGTWTPEGKERRNAGISEKRALELEARMRDLAESVEDPPYIERIK